MERGECIFIKHFHIYPFVNICLMKQFLPILSQDISIFFLYPQETVYSLTGWVQVLYLSVATVLVLIDSVATRTFRWKEYGELTHCQVGCDKNVVDVILSRR